MPTLQWIQKNNTFFSLHKIMLYRLILGFYFKCSNSAIVRLLLKLYCIVCCLIGYLDFIMSDEIYLQENAPFFYYDLVAALYVSVNILLSLITEEDYVMKFSSNLVSDSFPRLQMKQHCLVTYFLLFAALIVELALAWLLFDIFPLTELTLYFFKRISFYSGRLTTAYITENYQKQVKSLCTALKDNFETFNLSATQKYEHVKYFSEGYIKLSNNLNTTIKFLRVKVTFACVADFLRILTLVVYFNNITSFDSVAIMPWISEMILSVLMLCAPALLMEYAANDRDDIKIVLADQLLMIQDKKFREAIYDALEYIDACSAKYTIWNGFPFDINFVFGFFSISTAYIIALLQFSY